MKNINPTPNNVRKIVKKFSEKTKIEFILLDKKKFYIYPNVFSPKTFKESRWFGKKLSKIVGNKSLLEIGTGTGLIAFICSKNGAKVDATDINPEALKNAEFNFSGSNLKVNIYKSNVFDSISKNKKYDFIFWNHPFHKTTVKEEDVIFKSVFDYKYKYLEKYISGAKKYLKKNGRLLLGTGNVADFKELEKIAKKNRYQIIQLVKSRPMSDVTGIVNYILELKRDKS